MTYIHTYIHTVTYIIYVHTHTHTYTHACMHTHNSAAVQQGLCMHTSSHTIGSERCFVTFVRPSLSSYTIRHPGGHSGFAAPSQMASFQESRGCDSRMSNKTVLWMMRERAREQTCSGEAKGKCKPLAWQLGAEAAACWQELPQLTHGGLK